MSLWLDLRVGRKTVVGRLEVIRRTRTSELMLPPDAVCTYEVLLDGRVRGEVTHRYGDGAWALLRAALTEIELDNC
jgi:hypothetical protein